MRHYTNTEHHYTDTERHYTNTERHYMDTEHHYTDTERHYTDTERHYSNTERHYTDTERHCTDTEYRQYNKLICLMFYFSQPRNQSKTLKKKKRQLKRTRYNSKIFYKCCSIFDNKE